MPPVVGGEGVEGEGDAALPAGEGIGEPAVFLAQKVGELGEPYLALHAGQQGEGNGVPLGGSLQCGVAAEFLGQQGIGALVIAEGVVQPLAQSCISLRPQLIEEVGVGGKGLLTVFGDEGVQQAEHTLHHREGENVFVCGDTEQSRAQGGDIHGKTPFITRWNR